MRKLISITELTLHEIGDHVELTDLAMVHFATIGYNPPLMHGVVDGCKQGLVHVSNGSVSSWFSSGLWEKVGIRHD